MAMGSKVELPAIKPRSTRRRQSLREPSPDLIGKARDENAAQVTRVGLTFLGTAAFCLLTLFTQDSALLKGGEKISVPLAGPVSFFGFMLLGPAVLIVLRVYLQIYVELSDRLDRLARSMSLPRAPTLVPLKNPLIRVLSGVTFYLLLPLAMMLFAWRAAVFPAWGSGLLAVTTAVIICHFMLLFSKLSWRSRGWLSVGGAIIAGGAMLGFGPLHRPFYLYNVDLSGQWLASADLRKADLNFANLRDATLIFADLSGAELGGAHLNGANLYHANLSGAKAATAEFSDTTNLDGANLSDADLSSAFTLDQSQLDRACGGNANTKLYRGLKAPTEPCTKD